MSRVTSATLIFSAHDEAAIVAALNEYLSTIEGEHGRFAMSNAGDVTGYKHPQCEVAIAAFNHRPTAWVFEAALRVLASFDHKKSGLRNGLYDFALVVIAEDEEPECVTWHHLGMPSIGPDLYPPLRAPMKS